LQVKVEISESQEQLADNAGTELVMYLALVQNASVDRDVCIDWLLWTLSRAFFFF